MRGGGAGRGGGEDEVRRNRRKHKRAHQRRTTGALRCIKIAEKRKCACRAGQGRRSKHGHTRRNREARSARERDMGGIGMDTTLLFVSLLVDLSAERTWGAHR